MYFTVGFGVLVLVAFGIYVTSHRKTTRAPMTAKNFTIDSSAFAADGTIPGKYTCDDPAPVSPALSFSNVPAGTKSLALIMLDPDVPKTLRPDGEFVHWVLFNIPPQTTGIPEGSSEGVQGNNGAGKKGYIGPCPPPQYEPKEHRYFFTLYALDENLSLEPGATKDKVLSAMAGHELGSATLIGRYERQSP